MNGCAQHFPEWTSDGIPVPAGVEVTADGVRGMLLGLAMGDALGNATEAMNPPDRKRLHGDVTDYRPNRYAGGRAVGLPSDDTQLAYWTLESLIRKRGLDSDDLARTYCSSPIWGIGETVSSFIRAYKEERRPWHEAGQSSAGNGALMRIAPVLLPHLARPSAELWDDVICATALTHNGEAAVASSVGFVGLLYECLGQAAGERRPAEWWLDTFLRYARPVETGKTYTPRSRQIAFEGTICDFVERFVRPAAVSGDPTVVACERWHSAAYLLETVPSALLLLALHGHDPEEAIIRAVNDTRDNDTIAAIVGAAVGALHGERALPERWRSGLLGRTRTDDDGRVFELLEEALRVFPVHPRAEMS